MAAYPWVLNIVIIYGVYTPEKVLLFTMARENRDITSSSVCPSYVRRKVILLGMGMRLFRQAKDNTSASVEFTSYILGRAGFLVHSAGECFSHQLSYTYTYYQDFLRCSYVFLCIVINFPAWLQRIIQQ